MTADKSDSLWDRILQEQPRPAVRRTVEARLTSFDEHKKILLDRLRNNRPVNSGALDEEKWWRHLTNLAAAYFLWQVATPVPKRREGLRKLAEALDRARVQAENVRQDAVGSDLIAHLFHGVLPPDPRGQVVREPDGTVRVEFFPETDFNDIAAHLDAHKAAVLRAALDIPTSQSGPTASLPQSYIRALADLYRESTGRKPGAGVGQFYRFVTQFRAALDPSYRTKDESGHERVDESLRDAIKDALRAPKIAILPLNNQQ